MRNSRRVSFNRTATFVRTIYNLTINSVERQPDLTVVQNGVDFCQALRNFNRRGHTVLQTDDTIEIQLCRDQIPINRRVYFLSNANKR